ncbi:hypothetical protein PoB_002811000, partial [Plakobranchus ocellatus]
MFSQFAVLIASVLGPAGSFLCGFEPRLGLSMGLKVSGHLVRDWGLTHPLTQT